MKSAFIDFHSLVTVWAPQLNEGVRALLQRQFPHFFQEHTLSAPSKPDIILKPMGNPPPVTDANLRMSALFGFSVFFYRETTVVGYMHRGLPDILITLSDPLTIIYRPRAGIGGRLYGLLLFGIQLCLRKKDALLAHGAVVEKDGRSLVLSGHRGSGKTQLLLSLLNRGWNYLSDDKFILHKGTAYLFESHIYINDHLYACLPWLQSMVSRSPLQRGATVLRQKLRPMAYRILKSRSPWGIERILDPAVQYDIQTLFPSCSTRVKAMPGIGFLLFQGRDFSMNEVSRQPVVEGFSNIVNLLFADMGSLERLLALYSGSECESLKRQVSLALPDIPYYKILLPEKPNLEEVCQEMLSC